MTEAELLHFIRAHGGADLPPEHWRVAERLARKGLIRLGRPEGPWHDWRRADVAEGG